jgi:hypothetical protein
MAVIEEAGRIPGGTIRPAWHFGTASQVDAAQVQGASIFVLKPASIDFNLHCCKLHVGRFCLSHLNHIVGAIKNNNRKVCWLGSLSDVIAVSILV